MTISILVHIENDEPIFADVDELPDPTSQAIACANLRRRDGKEIHYIDRDAVQVFIPWHRITMIEVISAEEEAEVISFVRE